MNPQQPTNPAGPPPNPISPDMVIPSQAQAGNNIPSVNISDNSAPKYDPNYVPSAPQVASPVMAGPAPQPASGNVMPEVAPLPIQNSNLNIDNSDTSYSTNGANMMQKVAIGVAALFALLLILFLLWWFLFRGGDKAAEIKDTVVVERTGYEFAMPNGASTNEGGNLDINEPVDNYAFRRLGDDSEVEFIGNTFVVIDQDNTNPVDVYDESYKEELVRDIEEAYGLSSINIGDTAEYSSSNLKNASATDVTAEDENGNKYQGRIVTSIVNEKSYNFTMMAPVEDWEANQEKVEGIFSSFKVTDNGSPAQATNDNDEEADLFVQLKEAVGPKEGGVEAGDVLEYTATVNNSGPDSIVAKSAELVFSTGSESVELVSLNDSSEAFDCNINIGQPTSVDGKMNCTITKDLTKDDSLALSLRYKHTSEFSGTVKAEVEVMPVKQGDTAWKDAGNTKDSNDATEYSYATMEEAPTVTTEQEQEPTSSEPQTENLPDTAGAKDIALYVPLVILLASVLALVSNQSTNRGREQ